MAFNKVVKNQYEIFSYFYFSHNFEYAYSKFYLKPNYTRGRLSKRPINKITILELFISLN